MRSTIQTHCPTNSSWLEQQRGDGIFIHCHFHFYFSFDLFSLLKNLSFRICTTKCKENNSKVDFITNSKRISLVQHKKELQIKIFFSNFCWEQSSFEQATLNKAQIIKIVSLITESSFSISYYQYRILEASIQPFPYFMSPCCQRALLASVCLLRATLSTAIHS